MGIIIRTAEDLSRALETRLDPTLRTILICHARRLSQFPDHSFEELALIAVINAGDQLDPAIPVQVSGGRFSLLPEYVNYEAGWYDAAFVVSDDGYGLILIVQQGESAVRELMAACEAERA